MRAQLSSKVNRARQLIARYLYGPQTLAFLPALVLLAFWLGGELLLAATALGVPLLFAAAGGGVNTDAPLPSSPINDDMVVPEPTALSLVRTTLDRARSANLTTACLMVEAEGLDTIAKHHGLGEVDALCRMIMIRLRNQLRSDDRVYRLSDARFMILLAPSLRLDLETLLQLSARLQNCVEEPASIDQGTRYLSASVGFCGSARIRDAAGAKDLFKAANIALAEALSNGPSAIRAWSESMRAAHKAQEDLHRDVEKALLNGQIQPWFQPQVCTSTGRVTGVEALARWIHPDRGIIPPAQFLRCLEDSGQMSRLGDTILQHSLTALRGWDMAGLDVGRVSVNFSDAELREPKLVDRIMWELDRFGLTPPRLGIEVLESVIAESPDGIVARNIEKLGKAGCFIDLDDFGTGHASIVALRRFSVHRVKIDRSFVTRVDRDEDQRRMLSAILGMADRLGIATLAEGVESVAEHALLAQLGCDHVQGFGIARPMPPGNFVKWWHEHMSKTEMARKIGRETG